MKWTFRAALIALALMIAACSGGGEAKTEKKLSLETDAQKASYGIGVTIASQLKADKAMPFDFDAVLAGVKDGFAGDSFLITPEETQAALESLQKAAMEKEMQARALRIAQAVQAGQAFLAENAKKDGVKTTESGLQYKVLKSGEGESPSANDVVVVDYEGRFANGTVFDSSIKRGKPAVFPVNGVIPGWTEALQLMKPGDKWEVVVPPNLGYGNEDVGPIPGASVLVFDIDFKEVKAKAEQPKSEEKPAKEEKKQ